MTDRLPEIHSESTDEEIVTVILNVKSQYPADPHVAAELAGVLASSGSRIPARNSFSVDIASTGGPSSLSTLLCPLYLRIAGGVVPKLGVPGRPAGGIDCLSQIEGYRSSLSITDVERLLDDSGYAHFLANDQFAPLDSRMFRLRQQLGAQDVPTLVAASLLSKKKAVGVLFAGLDIRVAPHGNFGTTWSEAKRNARLFIEAGRLLSIDAAPVLTDGRFPYQPFIGRSEALLAMHYIFSNTANPWLVDHNEMCRSLGLACAPPNKRGSIFGATPADIKKHFYLNLIAQGATADAFEKLADDTASRHTHVLNASSNGFASFDLQGIRRVLVSWQNRGGQSHIQFPDPVGIILLKRPGDWVERNEPLATVRIQNTSPQKVIRDLEPYISNTSRVPFGPNLQGIAIDE